MGAANRKCVAMGNAGGIYGPENEQNWLYTGAPQSVASCFAETGTRWVRFWADWVQIKPDPNAPARWEKIDPQIQAARQAGMSIILTAYAFPPYATPNNTTDPLVFPTDFSRNSHWGNWIKSLYQRYDRFAPTNAGITIDALEVINEPNLQAKYQRDNGVITSHQKVFQMFQTADQIGAEHGHSLWLMGPALSDRREASDPNLHTPYEQWMDLFLALGFRGNSKWIWSHHNYIDCESADTSSPSNSTNVARAKLINKWSGYSDGDGPALFVTEGGSRLSKVGDSQTRQRDTVVNRFNTGVSSPGIGMFANYLMYDAAETPSRYTGLRNRVAADGGGKRMVYPNAGTTGWANLQTGHRSLRDWRGSENLGPWLQWDPALATMRPGHLAAFAVGGGNPRNCWINQRVDSNWWTGWQSLGGECYSGPAAVSRQNGIMDLFVKGPGEQIWATAFTPGWWGGWWSLGGWATSDPAVCSMHSQQLELFVRGPDNRLYHKWWGGGDWTDWYPMDNHTWSSGPGAVSMKNGRMDVVIRGNNNHIYHYYFTSDTGWHGPYSLEAPTANGQTMASTAARICSWSDRRLDVFARGADGKMYRRMFDDVWGKWEPVLIFSGGPFGCAVESWEPGRIDMITVESSGNVYRWMHQY